MAKVKKISVSDSVTIDSKTKSQIYEFAADATFNYLVDDEDPIYDYYLNFASKSGNNLVITTVFENTTTFATKNITITFKNFFNSKYEIEVPYMTAQSGTNYSITKYTNVDDQHLFGEDGQDYLLAPSKKKSQTEVTTNNQDVFDIKGNDIYTSNKPVASFFDLAGNDTYKSTNNDSTLHVRDYAGKDTYDFDGAAPEILEFKGKDKYIMKNYTAGDYYNDFSITDYAGNDSYELDKVVFKEHKENAIVDYAGNDKYKITDSKKQNITDEKGNDKYNIGGLTDGIEITDNDGKDTYNMTGAYNPEKPEESFMKNIKIVDSGQDKDTYNLKFVANNYESEDSRSIVDDGGNDTYNLQATTKMRIHDISGNDTYNLKAATVNGKKINIGMAESIDQLAGLNMETQIYDDSGNDKYNITHSYNSVINDSEGKDTYNINGESLKINQEVLENKIEVTLPTVLMTEINDTSETSNDTYNIGNVTNSLYIFGNYTIKDYGGDDTFNIKNAGAYFDKKALYEIYKRYEETGEINPIDIMTYEFSIPAVSINSKKGNDKYNASNSLVIMTVDDEYGNDNYSFKNITGSVLVSDYDGNDTYKVSNNKSTVKIGDKSGDDTYIIDKLTLKKVVDGSSSISILDTGGNDTVKVSSLKESNIIYMADFNKIEKDGYVDSDFGLIIYDKKNGGLLKLKEFYEITKDNETMKYSITDFGDGNIETFKAGKKNINLQSVDACAYDRMEELREQVGAWLTARDYDSVEQVLLDGSKDDISALIQIFQGNT